MSVMDFADYRLRMRAGAPGRSQRSYYLVGLTQGVRRGVRAAAAEPRRRLAGAILARNPRAVVHDPVDSWLRTETQVPAEFHRLTGLAGASDVCVAWLPDSDSAADAVAEIQAAHRGGATVVVITGETDDFVVRAFATVVLPDLDAFTDWLHAQAA
ncbi:hypothetical protein [Actinophytocola sp. NPDC049390]|uniref:hypothetical protein n=1 Tax=Actinophytocola sp. NPDC049390 TaxID=3363894 RepID=UPI0037ADDF87